MRIVIYPTFGSDIGIGGDLTDAFTVFGGEEPVIACSDGTLISGSTDGDVWSFDVVERGNATVTVYPPGEAGKLPTDILPPEDRTELVESGDGCVLVVGNLRWVALVDDLTRVVR